MLNGSVGGSLEGSIELAERLGAGLHVTGVQLAALTAKPAGLRGLLAASCHSAAELRRAAGVGADFAVLSPVRPTSSHPGVDGIGWNAFESAVAEATLPVFALGGMGPASLETAWQCGAQGIAAISALWTEPS